MIVEVLPNSIGPIIVMGTLDLGNAILIFSGLSFLGLGAPPPNQSGELWLQMVWKILVTGGLDHFLG